MESRQSDDLRLLDGSNTTDRNGISFCFVAKALCRSCPCQDSHVSISEWLATLPQLGVRPAEEPVQIAMEEWRVIRDIPEWRITYAVGLEAPNVNRRLPGVSRC
jgi:hypothetical protein